VIRGYEDGSFLPDRTVTRAEFASMLVRLFPFPVEAPQDSGVSLADIRNHWAKQAIERLAQLGIISGYPDGTFKPDEPITREQMVFVIMKLLNASELPETKTGEFRDISQTAPFAREAVEAAVKAGMISGYPDQTFRPDGNVTRAETAVILINLLKLDPDIREMPEMQN
jgi:hypothetical protein